MIDKIRTRRLKLAGHMKRHPEEMGHNLTMWLPTQGKRSIGKPAMTYVQQLEMDTGLAVEEICTQMMDRQIWRGMIGRGTPTSI